MDAATAPQVVGIGMDYRENDRPPELFEAAYRLAREAGLKTTAHAGEFGMPWNNVATAIDLLQVDRVDHGYTIVDNPALLQRCIERGLVFTVVPTNSYYLRTLAPQRWAQDHPIRQMLAAGLRLHPNTDDPTLHLVTPTGAWLMMLQLGAASCDCAASCSTAWMPPGWRRRCASAGAQWPARFDQRTHACRPDQALGRHVDDHAVIVAEFTLVHPNAPTRSAIRSVARRIASAAAKTAAPVPHCAA
jgi:adenosine deaminase